MIDYTELKAKAEAATKEAPEDAWHEYRDATLPPVVLELIAEVERLRKAAERVLLDVDDDGVAEAQDVAIAELRAAFRWEGASE